MLLGLVLPEDDGDVADEYPVELLRLLPLP